MNRREMLGLIGGGVAAGWAPAQVLGRGVGASLAPAKEIRIGMIGLDTSHVAVFTKLLNQDNSQVPELAGCRVVAAFPAGNAEFPLSRDRVDGFTKEVRALEVEIVASIEELLSRVDAVMLESVDGTQHLAQARPVFAARKDLFRVPTPPTSTTWSTPSPPVSLSTALSQSGVVL